MAIDRYGRHIHYLRISVTDHCNLRCIYCMPDNMVFRPNRELMQDEEIIRLVKIFSGLGFDKVRLTGGEPTVRRGIVELVRGIASVAGIRTVSMTSNGVLFKELADDLAVAGLKRVNFSLDTIDHAKFHRLTRRGEVDDVWAGIYAAEAAGLKPIKVNAVIVRGYNDDDIVDLARLTLEHAWQIRFIEMMPFAGATEFQIHNLVTAQEIIERIEPALGNLSPLNGGVLDGEARLYSLPGAAGDLGFISTVSQPFCADCTRARLTADGRLRMCLLQELEVDLLTPMRAGAGDRELSELIRDGIWQKPWGNSLAQGEVPINRTMSQIGG